jgi:hypothetical protein
MGINEWLQWGTIVLLLLRSINDRFALRRLERHLWSLDASVYSVEE